MEKDARLASSDNQQQQYAKFKMKDKEMNKEKEKEKENERAVEALSDDLGVFVDDENETDPSKGALRLVAPSADALDKISNDIQFRLSENQGEVRALDSLSRALVASRRLLINFYIPISIRNFLLLGFSLLLLL